MSLLRVGVAILVGLGGSGTAVQAQSASVAEFGPMRPPVTEEGNNERTTLTSDFALYELGWRQGYSGVETAMRFEPEPVDTVSSPTTIVTPAVDAGACGRGVVPPRSLDSRASRAREAFWPMIAAAECRWGLPTGLVDSVVLAESRYDPSVTSPAGAAGLAQLMPATASHFGVSNRFDPAANIEAGAHYLRALLDGFGGNVPLALAAYNAGPAVVRRLGHIPVNGETPDYVRRVLAYWTAPRIGPMSPAFSARQTAQMLGFYPSLTN